MKDERSGAQRAKAVADLVDQIEEEKQRLACLQNEDRALRSRISMAENGLTDARKKLAAELAAVSQFAGIDTER